jgi:DNA repair ATPase RecN
VTAEQLTTVLTNLLTSGGVITFFYFMVRSLRREITGLNKTIEAQNQTLEVMEKRIAETEKVGNIYRNLVSDLPEWVEKYKKFINESKDDVIAKLQQDKSEDEKVKEARQIELKRLELQEQMITELPKLREELISAFEAIGERIDAIYPYFFYPHLGLILK